MGNALSSFGAEGAGRIGHSMEESSAELGRSFGDLGKSMEESARPLRPERLGEKCLSTPAANLRGTGVFLLGVAAVLASHRFGLAVQMMARKIKN
eukprot:m.4428 g.4428  ORF g.4428 m.4428 type:complete len:95 (+) comp10718_c0_seq1:207-491(+)